jgi:hypothetical protein
MDEDAAPEAFDDEVGVEQSGFSIQARCFQGSVK